MISSFEVGAVFRLINEASPEIRKIMADVRKLQAALDKAKESIALFGKPVGMSASIAETRELAVAWDGVAKNAAAASRAMGRVTRGSARAALTGNTAALEGDAAALKTGPLAALSANTQAAVVPATELATAWEKVAAATAAATGNARLLGVATARAATAGNGGGGRAAHGRGGSGVHISNPRFHLPGNVHAGVGGVGDAGLVAGGLFADAIYQGAELQKESFLTWWHSNLPDLPANDQRIRDLIQGGTASTGYNFKEVGESTEDIFRLLKGTPNNGLGIAPELINAGATESLIKGTGLKESVKSIVEQAHQMGIYDLEQIKQMAPLIGFLSTSNPNSLPQMVRANSYAVPTLTGGLGLNAGDVMFETTAIARAGAGNSKSGTWVEHAFDRALPPDPHTMSASAYDRKMWAYTQAGLVDAKGKSTILNAQGGIDIDKFLSTVHDRVDKLPLDERNNVLKGVFGETGARGFELMSKPSVMEQTRQLKEEAPDFIPKYNAFMSQYAERSVIQNARLTYAEFNNLLSDIGANILPGVNKALTDFRNTLESLKAMVPGGKDKDGSFVADVIKGAAAGAGVGALVGSFGGPFGAVGGAVVGGALGVAKGYMDNTGGTGIDAAGSYNKPGVTGKPAHPVTVQTVPNAVNINLDGQSIAKSVMEWITRMGTFQTDAATPNGSMFFSQ